MGQYTITYQMPGMQYTPGVPVVVRDGNLLRDNVNGFFLAQLKLQNIYHKILRRIDVQIQVYDGMGNHIETRPYQYEGLQTARDQYAGGDVAVPLNDSRCAGFTVKVTGVLVADGMYIQADSSAEPIMIETKELKTVWENDPEMLKQYQLEYGKEHTIKAYEFADHWVCSCGTVNYREESNCHKCGCGRVSVLHPDMIRLEEDRDVRVAKEQEDKRRAKARAKRIGIIGGAIALTAVIIVALITQIIVPEKNYREAETLYKDGKYRQAYENFYNLNDYKDSTNYLEKAKAAYWQDVYKGILQGKVNENIPQEFYEYDPASYASGETRFSITDIDEDGIPELLTLMDGELSVCTITASNQFLEGPLYQESIYTGASENIEYCSAPAYIHSSYYNDAGMFQESWTSYPQNINANFYAYEEESYWDGTYMHYEISESENSYEVSEEEFYETLDPYISGGVEYHSLKFYDNSEANRDKVITK